MPDLDAMWGVTLTPAICEVCDWRYLLPSQMPTQQCPHCFKAELVPLEDEHIGDPWSMVVQADNSAR